MSNENNENNEIPEDEEDEDLEALFKKLNEVHKDKKPDKAQELLRLIRAQNNKNQKSIDSFNQDTGEENEHWKRSNNPQTTRLRALLAQCDAENELAKNPVWSSGYEIGKAEGYAEGKLDTEEWAKILVANIVKLYSNQYHDND